MSADIIAEIRRLAESGCPIAIAYLIKWGIS
jgi:hypothetical protein